MAGSELTARSARVKAARKLSRRAGRTAQRRFLAEGPQSVREALTVADCVVEVFATEQAEQRHPDLHRATTSQGGAWHRVDEQALHGLTDTTAPQGVVAVCRFVDVDLGAALAGRPRLVAMCAHVREPGNAGTVVRCADAAGADAVVLAGSSVDLYNGKTVRATVGSLFHLPVVFGVSVEEAVQQFRCAGLTVLAADGGGPVDIDSADEGGLLTSPTAWLFGNEAWGLPEADAALADHVVRVPIHGRAESLNLASAAAICLYASARAHRRGGDGGTATAAGGGDFPTYQA